MKTLLFLALLGVQTPTVKNPNTAQSTDILISWGYPALEVLDVPREFNGTLKVDSSKTFPARVTVSRASLGRNGLVTLEGQVTYDKACTLRFRSSLSMLVNPLISGSPSHSTWIETLERCPGKMVVPSSGSAPFAYASSMRFAEAGKAGISSLSAFSLVWTTSDGFSRELELRGDTSAYLRAYLLK